MLTERLLEEVQNEKPYFRTRLTYKPNYYWLFRRL